MRIFMLDLVPVKLVDSHVHLDDFAFDADRDAVVQRARDAGLIAMITVGTSVASSRAAVALAERYPDVYAAVAIHPHEAGEADPETMGEIGELAAHARVVAIGETGLDLARPAPTRQVQERVLRWHASLSVSTGLPLIIHCRDAFPAVLDILQEWNVTGVVMHAFSGTADIAQRCVDRGYMISMAGPVTFRNAPVPVEVARTVPLTSLLVETDAPVLAPVPFRGRRNEPAYLPYTVRRLAEVKGMPDDELAGATVENARRAFGIGAA
jgi:TatD DNase family protein